MPEHDTTLHFEDDSEIPITVVYDIGPGEPGLYTMAEGWVEPPRASNLVIHFVEDSNGKDCRDFMTDRDYDRIAKEIFDAHDRQYGG